MNDSLLARIVRESGWLTAAQFEAALRLAADGPAPVPLAVALAEHRLLSHARIAELLAARAAEFAASEPHHADRVAAWRAAARALEHGRPDLARLHSALARAEADPVAGLRAVAEALAGAAVSGPPASPLAQGDAPTMVETSGPARSDPETVEHSADRIAAGNAPTMVETSGIARPGAGTVGWSNVLPGNESTQLDRSETPRSAPYRSESRFAPGQSFGKYVLGAVLGRGGMGVVYRAHHPGLKADFAIKVLHIGGEASADDLARFRREAQAAARLHHPGIVLMHDVGEEDGTSYIAMELVDGTGLDQVLLAHPDGLPAAEALRIVADVADAIHHAHGRGVIHRDLKPANVIRTRDGRLKVMDFGLAKTVEPGVPGLTAAGELLGTPAYMSPEQAQGRIEEIDALSDVYQLGALLYHLLVGRAPYDGETPMGVVLQVAREDPQPPRTRRPGLDDDAETICLKAMERKKDRRYAGAGELAEDCRRCLRGEPIRARRAGRAELLLRWVRRRKTIVALAAVSVAALAIALATRSQARSLEQQRLDDLRSIARANLDATLFVRRSGGKLSEVAAQFLPPLEAAVRKVEERLPRLAEPRYHLGRMYRALMRVRDAEAEQEKALSRDPGFPRSLYERAILRASLYSIRLREVRDQRRLAKEGPPLPEAELLASDPEARRLRDSVVADLRRLQEQAAREEGEALPRACLFCGQGIFLLVAGREDERAEGERLLHAAIGLDPLLEEAYDALAQSLHERGDYTGAANACNQGLAVDRGYKPFLQRRGDAYHYLGRDIELRGEDPTPHYLRALADFESLVEQEPSHPLYRFRRGCIRVTLAATQSFRGADPTTQFESGLADLEESLRLDPGQSHVWIFRSMVRLQWAVHQGQRVAVDALVQGAFDDADEAVRLEQGSAQMLAHRAYLRTAVAEALTPDRAEAAKRIGEALDDYGKAIEVDPTWAEPRLGRASALSDLGYREGAEGRDPSARYAAAAADYETALEAAGTAQRARLGLGAVRMLWGDAKKARGDDPLPLYQGAREAYGSAAEAAPDDPKAWSGLARARVSAARATPGALADRRGAFDAALAEHTRALQLAPSLGDSLIDRATTLWYYADLLEQLGEDSLPALQSCLEDRGKLVAAFGESASSWSLRAETRRAIGEVRTVRGEDPRADFTAGITDLDEAVAREPGEPSYRFARGTLRLLLAQVRQERGEEPLPELARAEEDFTKTIELAPAMPETRWWRAGLRLRLAVVASVRGVDPLPALEGAAADARKALELRPGWSDAIDRSSEALYWLGVCLQARGQDPTAAYAEGIRLLAGADRPALRVRLGSLHLQAATWTASRGGDPAPALARAEAAFRAAGGLGDGRSGVGAVHLQRAIHADRHGGDPAPALAGALEEFAAAAAAGASGWAEPHARSGVTRGIRALALRDLGREGEGEAEYGAALADLEKALGFWSGSGDAWLARGALRAEWGMRDARVGKRLQPGRDPQPAWAAAEEDLGHAVELLAIEARAWAWRGRLRYYVGGRERDRGGDPAKAWEGARSDLERALGIDPTFEMARIDRARLRAGTGDVPGALEDYAKALETNADAAEALWRRAAVLRKIGKAAEADADAAQARGINRRAEEAYGWMDD